MRIFNFTQIGIIKQRTGPRGAAAIKQISPILISRVQTLATDQSVDAGGDGASTNEELAAFKMQWKVEILKLE